MAERTSQAARLRVALGALRDAKLAGPLMHAAARSQYLSRLRSERWFGRTFYCSARRLAWKGDHLTALYELAHYCVPRETWAVPRSKGESWVRREMTWSLLLLVQHKLGRDAAKALRAAYAANGVKYRPRRVLSQKQRADLGARLKKRTTPEATYDFAPTVRRRRITFDD